MSTYEYGTKKAAEPKPDDGLGSLKWLSLLYRSIYPFLYSDGFFCVSIVDEPRVSEIVVSGCNVTASTGDTLSIKYKNGLAFPAFLASEGVIPTYTGSLVGQL